MTTQILDMIARMGGADGVAAMASRVGLTPEQAQMAMAALAPAVAGGMAKQAQAGNGGLVDELAGMAAAFTGSAASDGAISQGTDILKAVLPGDTSNAVAQQAAARTGLDPSALMALLPMVATMAASALGNGTGTVAQPAGGGLGGLLGSLLGGGAQGGGGASSALIAMIDTNKDGNPLDELMGMAQGFLKR
jgi:hypothetical protein